MDVVLLGTAAGGGFPQWNCWCPTCRAVREDPRVAQARTQSSVALTADCHRWFLLNASPDVHRQVTHLITEAPETARYVPVEGVVLTDAELDHTLGVALLREARQLQVYATAPVRAILEHDSRVLAVTSAFAEVTTVELPVTGHTALRYRDGTASGLSIETFPVAAAGPPRFATEDQPGHTIGLIARDEQTGGTLGYIPGCGALDADLLARLDTVDLLLFDGTFWTDDELIRLGFSDRRARDMDHLPISGADGSLAQLSRLRRPRTVYTHINNTNPMLLYQSAERAEVERAGLQIGEDGMRLTL